MRALRGVLAITVVGALASAPAALAAAYQVDARTEAQAYQIRAYRGTTPDQPVLLPRRRLVQYLALNVFELVEKQPVGFESSLRIFADLGLPRGEAARIDGLHSEEVDLLYANLSYRGRRTEVRVGRQPYVDLMDYMAFDGARVRYVHPVGVGAEIYGGLWVKGSSLLGSSVYQPDGIRETDVRRIAEDPNLVAPAVDDIEPLYGMKLLVEGIAGLSGSVGYRRAVVAGKTDLERVALEARYGRGLGLNVLGGIEYDLFLPRVSQARLQARYDTELYAITAEAMRVTPLLSADSIFLFFATAPRDELRLRGDYTPLGPLRYYAQLVVDWYGQAINPDTGVGQALTLFPAPSGISPGASLGAAFRQGPLRSGGDLTFKTGVWGEQIWLDLTGGYAPEGARFSLDGRLSVARIRDGLNPLLTGTFAGAQLWGSYLFSPAARLSLVLEQNVNPFTRSDTKLFFLFDLRATL